MRSRPTSDKRSEDERRTNEPWEVHLELRTEERDEDRVGLPTQRPKFAKFFFTISLVGPRLRREGAEKLQPSQATKTREGEDKKELQGYTTKGRRTTWCLNSSLVAYAYGRTRASRSYQQRTERLPKDQSVKKLSTRTERLPKDQSVKKLSTKDRAPTEGAERQEGINKG